MGRVPLFSGHCPPVGELLLPHHAERDGITPSNGSTGEGQAIHRGKGSSEEMMPFEKYWDVLCTDHLDTFWWGRGVRGTLQTRSLSTGYNDQSSAVDLRPTVVVNSGSTESPVIYETLFPLS